MTHAFRTYNLATLQGIKAAERYKARIENSGESVKISLLRGDWVAISGTVTP